MDGVPLLEFERSRPGRKNRQGGRWDWILVLLVSFLLPGCASLAWRRYEPYSPLLGDPRELRQSVRTLLASLTLEEKIAQRCILHIPRGLPVEEVEDYIRARKPAGVILYRWNYDSLEDLVRLTAAIRRGYPAGYPAPFICADQEGGRVQAFRFKEFVQLPNAFQMGRYRDPAFIRAASYLTAVQLRETGVNMNLAPVLDVVEEGDSSIIGDRSFGGDPHWVEEAGRAYLAGMREARVIPVIKHFPGHGSTRTDSHSRLPVVSLGEEELFHRDLIPFQGAIQAGAPVVMTVHILFPEVDPDYPATLSRKILQGILRDRLKFGGVVMSDGLEMGALAGNYSLKETVKWSFQAGVDVLLLYTRYTIADIVSIVQELLLQGEISEKEIDAGVERVLALKQAYGLLP
ncbi:MAG: hypothetical protein Kow009_07740 [Spirochaetales bacterium]